MVFTLCSHCVHTVHNCVHIVHILCSVKATVIQFYYQVLLFVQQCSIVKCGNSALFSPTNIVQSNLRISHAKLNFHRGGMEKGDRLYNSAWPKQSSVLRRLRTRRYLCWTKDYRRY